ncbi:MAG: GNAT family N-acetyltransferase [Rhodobacterales bacterium]|nr:GNAT family N-acetyltransferase [Rhodobacterales bacterium]
MTLTIPTLTTERLTLRAPINDDFAAFSEFYASERSKFVGGPATAEQSWRMLAVEIGHWGLRGYGRWAVEETDTGKFVDIVGMWNPHGWPEPELGWDLMTGFEGKGYATEAALAARKYAYETLGWATAISLVAPKNDGSRAVAKRMGATFESHYDHERFGQLEIWRHIPATQAATEAQNV